MEQLTPYPMESPFLLGRLNCLLGGGECFSVGHVPYWLPRRGYYLS